MKKIFTLVLSVFPMIASGDYLDDKIAELTKQKLEKIAELEECQKSTKGLKIAGITTLGVSTIGIAANIGEAVTLKNLDKDISTAEASKQDLDKQIQAQKAKNAAEQQAANNTCGVQTCAEDKKSGELSKLNAKDVVCVNGEWQASQCKDGFSGTAATCTLNAKSVTYYTNCVQSQGGDEEEVALTPKYHEECTEAETQKINGAKKSWYVNGKCIAYSCKDKWFLVAENRTSKGYCVDRCPEHQRVKWNDYDTMACDSAKSQEEKPCPEIDDEWKDQNNAKQGECDKTTGENYITQCKDGYDPVKDANGKIEKCKYICSKIYWAKSDAGLFCGRCYPSDNGWLDVEVLGGVLNFDELKQYFDEKYSVKDYVNNNRSEDEIYRRNGRYCYHYDACFDTLQKLKENDFEDYCLTYGEYKIIEHIIDYSIVGTNDGLQIQAEVNNEPITITGRVKEDLVSQLDNVLREQGYTDFKLVEKK